MKKLSLFFTLAIVGIAFVSCGSNLKTTAVLNNQIDSLNYAFGLASGSQFKEQVFFQEKDTAKLNTFYKAFLNGFNANFKKMSEGNLLQLNGTSAGMNLSMETKEGYIFNDSTWKADKPLINKLVLEVLSGKDTVGGFTMNTAREFYYKMNREKRDTVPHAMTPEKLDSLNRAFAVMVASGYNRELDNAAKRGDFIKGFKAGMLITDSSKKYNTIGSYIAAQGFDALEKNGLLGDSTLTLQPSVLAAGINAGVMSDTTIMTKEAAQKYVMNLQATMRTAKLKEQFGKNIDEGAKFLADNAKRPEVKVTESGLQYEIIKEGKGEKPAANDTVTVNYVGTLINDTVFDSSIARKEPAKFVVNRVIPGWTEALQLMPVGSKWKLYIPYQLAYGEQGAGGKIEPFSTLIFDVELLKIQKATATPPMPNAANIQIVR